MITSCYRFVVSVAAFGVLAVLTASPAAAEQAPDARAASPAFGASPTRGLEVSPEGLVTSCFQQPRGTPCEDNLGRVGVCFEGECIPHDSDSEQGCFQQRIGTPCIDRFGLSGACFEGECLPR
jgi:hypothetical protein